MTRRIGLLSISMGVLALAVAGYFVQGAGAVSPEPVAIADFGLPQAAVANASGGDEYDFENPGNALFHPTGESGPSCADTTGVDTIELSDDVAILCKNGEALGFLVTSAGMAPKFVKDIPAKQECPATKDVAHPDA
jgi:hypothetical protein